MWCWDHVEVLSGLSIFSVKVKKEAHELTLGKGPRSLKREEKV